MKIVCLIDFGIQAVSPKPKYINIITSLTLITFSRETGVLKTGFDMNFLCLNSRSVSKESFTRMRKKNCFPLSINLFFWWISSLAERSSVAPYKWYDQKVHFTTSKQGKVWIFSDRSAISIKNKKKKNSWYASGTLTSATNASQVIFFLTKFIMLTNVKEWTCKETRA